MTLHYISQDALNSSLKGKQDELSHLKREIKKKEPELKKVCLYMFVGITETDAE